MKRFLLAAFAAAAAASFIVAQPGPPAGEKKAPETELGKSMDKMSTAFRTLRRQVADPSKNAESLALVATIRSEAMLAKKEIPMKAADVPAADKAKFTSDFAKRMDEMISVVERLETALKANDNAAAEKAVGDLASAQKSGHDDFRKKKEEPKKG